MGFSRELPDRSNNDYYLGIELWKSSVPLTSLHDPQPQAAKLLVFTVTLGFWFLGHVKMPHSSLVLTKIQPFFLNKHSLEVTAKPLISRVLKSWFWQFLPTFSHCSYEGEDFQKSYSTIPAYIMPNKILHRRKEIQFSDISYYEHFGTKNSSETELWYFRILQTKDQRS